MDKYGIKNVRGGSFCRVRLKESEISTLKTMIKGSTGGCCYLCGIKGHYANDCDYQEDECNEEDKYEEYEDDEIFEDDDNEESDCFDEDDDKLESISFDEEEFDVEEYSEDN